MTLFERNPRSFAAALVRAWRSFARRPGVFIIAVSSLAVALGLATAVIAQVDSLLNPVSPIENPARLYEVSVGGRGQGRNPTSREIEAVLARASIFERTVSTSMSRVDMDGGAFVGRERYLASSPAYFELLGAKTRIGRLFSVKDGPNALVAVVSDDFWRRYYANRPSLKNAVIRANGEVYDIVGVLDRGFNVIVAFTPVIIPNRTSENFSRSFYARIKRGVTDVDVRQTFRTVEVQLTKEFGRTGRGFRLFGNSFDFRGLQFRNIGALQWAMLGCTAFIMIIACANVSALMLARGVAQRRDQALRLALGAGRRDLVGGVVAEITILAVAGGTFGIVIAQGAMGVLRAVTPADMSYFGFLDPRWNPRVFVGLFGATVLAIALSAAIPAWFTARIAPAEPLKDSSGTTTGRPGKRFQLLVVGELALAMVLLSGAALVTKTVRTVATFDFGYAARSVEQVTASIRVTPQRPVRSPDDKDNPAKYGIVEFGPSDLVAVVERLRSKPGVRTAAWVANDAPWRDVVISDETYTIDSLIFRPKMFNIGPGFFETMGIALVAGRDFTDGDRDTAGAVIVDERAAKQLFPHENPIGRMVKLGPHMSTAQWVPVVGIVRNAIHDLPEFPELEPLPVIYSSRLPPHGISPWFVFRNADPDDREVMNTAVRTVRDAMPIRTSVEGSKWIKEYEALLAARTFSSGVLATLSLASLVLAAAGLFGVLSYVVGQRMREFAVRVALGATRRNMLRLVFRDGMVMALGGTAIGAFIGFTTGFVVYDWLWGVYPVDAGALVTAEATLLAVTLAATVGPALRASRANPVEVMRAN